MATRRKSIISEGHFRILQSSLRIDQSNSSSVLRITCSYYGSPFRPGNKTETVLVTHSEGQRGVCVYKRKKKSTNKLSKNAVFKEWYRYVRIVVH